MKQDEHNTKNCTQRNNRGTKNIDEQHTTSKYDVKLRVKVACNQVIADCQTHQDMYESFGLTQLISEPTRETEQTSTLIDHTAVSNVRNISKSGVVRTAISDHHLVYAVRKHLGGIERKHKQIHTRQMKNFNEEAFLRDLSAWL